MYTLHFVVWSSTQMKYTCTRSVFFVVPKLINNLNELVLAEKLMLMQDTNFCSWNTNKMYFPSSTIYLYFIHENYSWYQSRAGLYFVSMIFKLSFLLLTSICFSMCNAKTFMTTTHRIFCAKPFTSHIHYIYKLLKCTFIIICGKISISHDIKSYLQPPLVFQKTKPLFWFFFNNVFFQHDQFVQW